MPNIAELFVSLGIKGSEKTLNVLSNVKVGMGNIIDTSLAAKAAILAAVYALEQLTTGAAQDGAHLKNLATYLDMSVESLQKWNYAAQQGNISNQEFEQSLGSIQQKIKDFQVKHTLPDGSYIFADETNFDFRKKFGINDLLPKLLEFSQNKKYSRAKIEEILGGWGLTPNEIGAAINGIFSAANLKNAPFLKGREVDSLAKVNVELENIENKVKMLFAHFTAKHGKEIVGFINEIITSFIELGNQLDKFISRFAILDKMSIVLKSIRESVHDLSAEKDATKLREEKEKRIKEDPKLNDLYKAILEKDNQYNKGITGSQDLGNIDEQSLNNIGKALQSLQEGAHSGLSNFVKGGIDLLTGNKNQMDWQSKLNNIFDYKNIVPQPININQNLYFGHPGIDAPKVMDLHSKSVGHAVAQATRNINQSRVT